MTPPCSAHSSSFSASTTPRPNHKSLIRTCSLTSDPCTSARRRARTRHALCCTPARERARVHSLSFARHRHHANPMCILSTIQRRSRTMTPLISLGLCTISSTSRIPRSPKPGVPLCTTGSRRLPPVSRPSVPSLYERDVFCVWTSGGLVPGQGSPCRVDA